MYDAFPQESCNIKSSKQIKESKSQNITESLKYIPIAKDRLVIEEEDKNNYLQKDFKQDQRQIERKMDAKLKSVERKREERIGKGKIQIEEIERSIKEDSKYGRFICLFNNCNKSFSRKSRLKAHQHLHFGSQPYKCNFPDCEKAFSEKPNLLIHSRIHTNERPFICKYCLKSFTTKGNMKDHERRHSKQRPYECNGCNQRYYRKNILTKHIMKC